MLGDLGTAPPLQENLLCCGSPAWEGGVPPMPPQTYKAWLLANTGSSQVVFQRVLAGAGSPGGEPGVRMAHRDTPAYQPASPGHSLLRLVPAQPGCPALADPFGHG